MNALAYNSQTTTLGSRIINEVYDYSIGKFGSYEINHSNHSKKRSSQRGIKDNLIPYILDFGEVIQKQGLFYYAVTKKSLPKYIKGKLRSKLNNMVVVMSGDSNTIITCYKSNNAIKHIRRKQVRLA